MSVLRARGIDGRPIGGLLLVTPLTKEQAETALRRYQAGESWNSLAREAGYNKGNSLYRGVLRALGDERSALVTEAPGRPVDESALRIMPSPAAAEDLLDVFIDAQEKMKQYDTRQTFVHTPNLGNKPIGVVFTGDWHLGGKGTDHKRLKEDMVRWQEEEGLFVVGIGDYSDNFLTRGTPPAANEQVFQPEEQGNILRGIMERRLRDKLLALLKGNHDDWSYKTAQIDPVKQLAADLRVPYMGHGGRLFIHVGEQVYVGNIRHRFQGQSAITPTNTHRRFATQSGGGDFTVLAHTHDETTQGLLLNGERHVYVRCGTYKVSDEFPDAIGLATPLENPSVLAWMPMLIFFPDVHDVVQFDNFHRGITDLRAERAKYA